MTASAPGIVDPLVLSTSAVVETAETVVRMVNRHRVLIRQLRTE
jgi:hypothetical protein